MEKFQPDGLIRKNDFTELFPKLSHPSSHLETKVIQPFFWGYFPWLSCWKWTSVNLKRGRWTPPKKMEFIFRPWILQNLYPPVNWPGKGNPLFWNRKYIFQIGGFSNQLPEGTLVFQGENTTNHIPCSNKDVADRTDGFGDEFSVFLDVPGT